MKLVIHKIRDLRTLYIRQLRRILSGEEVIVRAMPAMIGKATDAQLRQAFESHKKDAEMHLKRLRIILEGIAGETEELTAKSMRALVGEGEEAVEDSTHDAVRDAALIVASLRIQHDGIATYGSVLHFARVLGRESDQDLLHSSLNEEQQATHLLEMIAERVNPAAKKAA